MKMFSVKELIDFIDSNDELYFDENKENNCDHCDSICCSN